MGAPHVRASQPQYHTSESNEVSAIKQRMDAIDSGFGQVIETLNSLSKKHDAMADLITKSRIENAEQHGDVEAKIAGLTVEISALKQRFEDVLETALADANEKITKKKFVIKVLAYIITALVSMIAEGKLHIISWVKEIGG